MKFKWLFYPLTVALFALMSYSLYRTYTMFDARQQLKQVHDDLTVLKKLGRLVADTGDEAFDQTRYFGVKGVNYLDRLMRSRQQVDRSVSALKQTMEKKGTTLIDAGALTVFVRQTQAVRRQIDAMDSAYMKRFEETNASEPIAHLFQKIHYAELRRLPREMRREIVAYFRMLFLEHTLQDGRTMTAYFLARRMPLSSRNMAVMESILEGKGRSIFRDNLEKILPKEYPGHRQENGTAHKELAGIRGDIFEHAGTGNFSHRLYDVEALYLSPLSAANRQAEQQMQQAQSVLKSIQDHHTTWLIRYAVIAAILAAILIVLFTVLRAARREKQALEESLRAIVGDLNVARRKELETIMRKRDRTAIYRFLSKTTMDARAAEERAHQAEKAKNLFLANMSHEIRTPLNGILGFTQLMQSTPLNPEQKEFMEVIGGSSENLLKIVNDILDLSKINAEKIELELIPFSLINYLEKAVEPHAARALERGIDYSTFIDPTLPIVNGDPTKLTQVMTNLIGNAVKFTNEGGTVEVNVRLIGQHDGMATIRFSIKDSGIGISPEQMEKIFEPFSQADASTTRQFGGTGLGLTITRDIIRHMDSQLQVESEPGRGSEFYFELTLERVDDDEDIHARLKGLTLAYYHAGHFILRQMERNLEHYARASGARFRMINEQDLDLLDDVDFLLLDYADRETQENIEKFLWLGKRTILISTVAEKHATDNLLDRVERVIYRPLTASKLIRACVPEGLDADSDAEEAVTEMSLKGMRILVAEDNPINQKLIGRVLEGMEIEPVLVSNGKVAAEMRTAQTFDAILMDIQMPVMGGVESTQTILKYEHTHGKAHVPIIALTANALQGDRERYLREGFDDYISKPVNLDQLRQVLHLHCFKPDDSAAQPEDESKLNADGFLDIGLYNFYTVLMYSRSTGLVQRLHHDALSYAGHTFSTVSDEVGLLDHLEHNPPEILVIDSYSIDLDNCTLFETLRRIGVRYFIYGSLDPILGCDVREEEKYTSVAALLKALQ